MSCVRSKLLKDVVHGFGLHGYSIHDHLEEVRSGHAKFFKTNQVHGDRVVRLGSGVDDHFLGSLPGDEAPQEFENVKRIDADSFMTNEAGVVCFVRTADCVPILIYDPVKKAVAAVHSGWKGTSLGIVVRTVERMEKEFGSRRKDMIAAIGPSISGSCYEVGEEVFRIFSPEASGKGKLDLQNINRELLLGAGVDNVDMIPICNHCDTRFASYRRDRSETARQINFIML